MPQKDIEVWFKDQDQPKHMHGALFTYQEGSLLCFRMYWEGQDWVEKFPMQHIWRVKETITVDE